MSIVYGPRIIQKGLVFHFDAYSTYNPINFLVTEDGEIITTESNNIIVTDDSHYIGDRSPNKFVYQYGNVEWLSANGMFFNGSNTSLKFRTTELSNQIKDKLTVEFMTTVDTYSNGNTLLAVSSSSNTARFDGFGFYTESGNLVFYVANGSTNISVSKVALSSNSLPKNVYYGTYDGVRANIYISGTLANTGTVIGTVGNVSITSSANLSIGGYSNNTHVLSYSNCRVYGVKLYSTQLTEEEMIINTRAIKGKFR